MVRPRALRRFCTADPASLHRSVRPLPKMPNSVPVLPENPKHKHHVRTEERSPHTNPATSTISTIMPQRQRTTDFEQIRHGDLSKPGRHLGYSIPPDVIPPKFDRDEAYLSSDEEECCDLPTAPMTPECLSELTAAISPMLQKMEDEKMIRRFSRRWLREKKGRRWVEDDYNVIIQSLRTLR